MRCIHCGNDVKPGDPSCRHCGARNVRPSTEEASGRRPGTRMAAVALLLLAAGGAFWSANEDRVASWSNQAQELFRAVADEPPPETPPPAAAAAPPASTPPAPEPPVAEPPATTAVPSGSTSADRRSAAATKKETPPVRRAEPTPSPTQREAAPNTSQPVRAGGSIATPTKVKDVRPVYPADAIQARIQGIVIIEATIGKDGAVERARVLRSIPLLDAAALDAVRQWRFTQTTLNGEPVPVIMTVTVNFALQ